MLKSREKLGNEATLVSDGALKYITFDALDEFEGDVVHCMSTRQGGVSTGRFSSLNLGFKSDNRSNVEKNFEILCGSVGLALESLVLSDQVHDKKIRLVGEADRGKGFARKSDILGYDGLMTNVRGVTLVTFYADCVPVYFYDKSKKAIALVHSGWRGTLCNIAVNAVDRMNTEFGSKPQDLVAVIGPSIGKCCFEVGLDVFDQFAEKFENESFYTVVSSEKMKIDLQGIIKSELTKRGLMAKNIHKSDICTVCRKDLFFSYRREGGGIGSLAAFMQLR